MTSNIRVEEGARIGFGMHSCRTAEHDHDYLKKYFRTELINRVDEVVIFNRLERDSIRKIVSPMLEEVRSNLRKLKGVDMVVGEQVIEFLIGEGYHPDFGVRELKRTVDLNILGGLSELMVNGKIDNATAVIADIQEGRVVFSIERSPDPARFEQLLCTI